MYAAILMSMAMSGPADVAQCSARSSCASVQRVVVVQRAACSTAATKASCSTSVAVASCSRGGILANHHARKADRLQHRADRHYSRAGVVYVEVLPATPTPAKQPEKAK